MLIENGLIGLRIMADQDVDDFFEYRKHPDVCRFQGFKPMNLEDCQKLVQDMNIGIDVSNGQWLQLAICTLNNNQMIGDCGYKIDKIKPHVADIGYTISPKYQNQGLGTQAVKLLTKFLFEKLEILEIVANIDPRNVSSAKVLQKANFNIEIIKRLSYWDKYDEMWVDEHYYSLLNPRTQI